MIFSAIASKLIAVVLGPSGIGLYSILAQVQQTATLGGTVGGGNALVQGIASKQDESRNAYLVTVFWIFLAGSLTVGALLVLLAPLLAPATIGENTPEAVGLIRWLALPTVLAGMLAYLNGVLNGFRAIGRLAIVQAAGAGTVALLAYPVSNLVDTGYPVAFVALLSAQLGVSMLLALGMALRSGWLRPFRNRGLRPMVEKRSAKHFLSIAVATLFVGLMATGTLLVVRSLIVQESGLEGAGIFNVAWTLGMTYPMVVLTSFGTYYLPTLCRTTDPGPKNELMMRVFRSSTFVMIPLVVMAIVLNPLIVGVLYSNQFLESLDTVRWMLIADYLKAASWVFGMPMIAFADMRTYVTVESLWYAGFLGIAAFATLNLGSIEVIGFGFMVLYAVYLIYTAYYVRTRHGFVPPRKMAALWFAGLGMVALASIQTWSETSVNWLTVSMWAVVVVVFSWITLSKRERGNITKMLRLG